MCLLKQIKKKLPIGIENFAKLQAEDFYYVDKTMLIKELLDNWAEVNLFTRPRRFGKTLNMSMLKAFFELNGDKNCFKGTRISREVYLCEQYMGKFPVIFISLKSISAQTYEKACDMAIQIVNGEARRFQYLLESERLTKYDKDAFKSLLLPDMKESVLCSSLRILSELLEKHHGQKVILLIDEYDVPLAKAFELGYYNSMTLLIRNLFENALKTNDSLKFAVLTGCMRISKESIFTGLNNLKVLSVADVQFDEYFGFTDSDVKNILEYYELSEHYDEIKMWYDGYRFGNVEVYCPWDVINYCDELRINNMAQPQNYWSNTSSNEAVKRFIQETDKGTVRKEIEKLIAGETIVKEIHQELTYQDMYASIENLWSVLFTTGYLTQTERKDANTFMLTIPNMEIRNIFLTQIMEYFKKTVLPTDLIINNNEFSIASLQYVELKELKALLAMKQIEAKNKNVDCTIRVLGVVNEINMDTIDLIRIVGILFDNAIQAAEAIGNGKVTCTIKQKDIFRIEIRNNYIGNIEDTSKLFEKGYTTKESGSGIGLYNFLNIIHNYDNAIYSVTLDNNEFIIRITIS